MFSSCLPGFEYTQLFVESARMFVVEFLGCSPTVGDLRAFVDTDFSQYLDLPAMNSLMLVGIDDSWFSIVESARSTNMEVWGHLLFRDVDSILEGYAGDVSTITLGNPVYSIPGERVTRARLDLVPCDYEQVATSLVDGHESCDEEALGSVFAPVCEERGSATGDSRVCLSDQSSDVDFGSSSVGSGCGQVSSDSSPVSDEGLYALDLRELADSTKRFGWSDTMVKFAVEVYRDYFVASENFRGYIGSSVMVHDPGVLGYCYLSLFDPIVWDSLSLNLGAFPNTRTIGACYVAALVCGLVGRHGYYCVENGQTMHLETFTGGSAKSCKDLVHKFLCTKALYVGGASLSKPKHSKRYDYVEFDYLQDALTHLQQGVFPGYVLDVRCNDEYDVDVECGTGTGVYGKRGWLETQGGYGVLYVPPRSKVSYGGYMQLEDNDCSTLVFTVGAVSVNYLCSVRTDHVVWVSLSKLDIINVRNGLYKGYEHFVKGAIGTAVIQVPERYLKSVCCRKLHEEEEDLGFHELYNDVAELSKFGGGLPEAPLYSVRVKTNKHSRLPWMRVSYEHVTMDPGGYSDDRAMVIGSKALGGSFSLTSSMDVGVTMPGPGCEGWVAMDVDAYDADSSG